MKTSFAEDLRKSIFGCIVALVVVLPRTCGAAPDENSIIAKHTVAHWRSKPSYLDTYSFASLGKSADKHLNSCTDANVLPAHACSGHGLCVDWFEDSATGESLLHQHSFCKCDIGWADPECRTERKSQLTAFMLSVFFGVFGADQFYLGFWRCGIVKLFTLGGAGFWWIFDIVRIGSTAVETKGSFKVAQDVHHWAFVLVVISLSMFIGFAVSIWSVLADAAKKFEQEEQILQKMLPCDDPHASLLSLKSASADKSFAPSYNRPPQLPVKPAQAMPSRQADDEEASQGSFRSPSRLLTAPPSPVVSLPAAPARPPSFRAAPGELPPSPLAAVSTPVAGASPSAPSPLRSALGNAPNSASPFPASSSPAPPVVSSLSPGTIIMR